MNAAETIEAATANFVTHATWLSRRAPGARVESSPSLTVSDSGLAGDTFNIVCGARLSGREADDAARRVITHFARVGRPFSWWVAPGDLPVDLVRRLETAGLEKAETELAMAARLDGRGPGVGAGIEGLELRRVTTEADLGEYARISAENWEPPDPTVAAYYARSLAELAVPACPMRLFLASVEGRGAGCVEATVAGGVVGIYGLSTRRAFRRRGIASALLREALRDARAGGVTTAVLQAAEAGVGLYRRLGFEDFGLITEMKPPIHSVR